MRSWHCGNGGNGGEAGRRIPGGRKAMYEDSLEHNYCIVGFSAHPYFQEQSRWKHQLKPFLINARKGDKIFLHCSHLETSRSVSHYGIYTGECRRAEAICGLEVEEPIWLIFVDRWIPLNTPFQGAGIQKTLYEVTGRENYT